MERPSAWKKYDEAELSELEELNASYRAFISENKTERECVAATVELARAAGYADLEDVIAEKRDLKPGDKVYAVCHGKTIMLVNLGSAPLEEGFNILGAHIDSPRLDVKQNPVYEENDLAYLDTHYYGGIKNYQWVAMPLAIHGVVCKKDGSTVNVCVGEDPSDPVFCISDLLPHLGVEQMKKPASEVIDAENLDLIVAGRPVVLEGDDAPKEPVKQMLLDILSEKYDMDEEDFLSAELEVVPAGPAREMGWDRSMILGYGQDDRVCAYTSLLAQLDVEKVERTSITLLVDKEEIGSVGATGMQSRFFENAVAEIMAAAGCAGELAMRRALAKSRMLSSDVSAAVDRAFADRFEKKNAAFLGRGLCFNKFTGSRGKSGSNDANAEYMAFLRDVLDQAGVSFQTCELGRVNVGGGGTIAYILAKYGMQVIDSGIAVLSMHAPWEVTAKSDVYEGYKGYKAFLERA